MKSNPDNSHLSRTQHSAESFAVSTDVAKWRQDVEAFTTATRQMLDSINQQLSNGLANGQTQIKIVPGNQTASAIDEQPASRSSVDKDISEHHPLPQNGADEVAIESEKILAKLKAQLAEQLNQ